MSQKIELTDDIISWMNENFGKASRKECALHCNVSVCTIDRWARQLGLFARKSKDIKQILETNPAPEKPIKDRGYCIDCEHYVVGGTCARTARYTGALNEKPCFKRNE